jgi:hypothetical protein
MTERTWARFALPAGPLFMLAYGLIRLSDPDHGPGLAWSSGHLALIAGVVCFGVTFLSLRRLARPATTVARISTGTATALGLVGTLAVVAQAVIDLVVGFRSTDRAGMNRLFEQIQSHPGVQPAVYSVGPLLFYVGMIWLVVELAARRRISPWCPALVVVGTVTMSVSLELIPVGAVLFGAAFLPLTRPQLPGLRRVSPGAERRSASAGPNAPTLKG